MNALCQIWLKLTQWFWRRFQNLVFINIFFAVSLFSSLEKKACPFILLNLNPFTQGGFVLSLTDICPAVLEKKMKIYKVYRQTDVRRTTGDQKSSLELSTLVS